MRVKLLALSVLVAATLPFSASAAENCAARYTSAFASLESAVSTAGSQASADAQVEHLFGPRPGTCEDGAYEAFLSGFERFARKAVRDAQPRKQGKNVMPPAPGAENSLRLAIAAIRKSPVKVSPKDGKIARTSFLQVRSNINAVADDAGLTPMMQQLLDTIASVGVPPAAAEDAPPHVTTGPGSAPSNVQAIRIPLQPMPTWAIIKLYEMRDHLKAQDSAAVQIKLQDIINWIESTTQGQQQQ
jgi:hypothetical protein